MRLLCVVALAMLACAAGCGYQTIGGENYRFAGASAATLGSYGIEDRSGAPLFEHFGTPPLVRKILEENELGAFTLGSAATPVSNDRVEVLAEFDEIDARQIRVDTNAGTWGSGANATLRIAHLTSPRRVVERIEKSRLVQIYNQDKDLRDRLRGDSDYRIVTAIVREIDTIMFETSSAQAAANLDEISLAALCSAALKSAGASGVFANLNFKVHYGGRVTGYQISHLCWGSDGTLLDLKTDRPLSADKFPGMSMEGTVRSDPVLSNR
jgi:hypothetical protein